MTKEPKQTALPRTLVEAVPTGLKLAHAINATQDAIDALQRELKDNQAKSGAIALARAYVVLHRLNDKMTELWDDWSRLYEAHKKEVVPQAFEAEGITSIPLAEGFRVGMSSQLFASIRKGMRDQAYAWIRKQPGLKDLITETINSSTLSAAARHLMEEENKELPAELFNVALLPTISVTATRSK